MIQSFRSKLIFPVLLSSLLSCGQIAIPQNDNREIADASYLEAYRINPQDFDCPMHIPPLLSGGFAELRNNHLHSGLDFKTQGRSGIPVYPAADGWISRIRISAFGFGYALYVDHPNGFTTVYGHLSKYAPLIDSIAKSMQYRVEQFELDTMLKPGKIPVKRNQIIAYSGNTGGSAAPHLHFEIRDTKTEETIDPLLWYSGRIKDKTPPRFQAIAMYAPEGEGVLSTGAKKISLNTIKNPQGNWGISGTLPTAWGKIGLGLKAYDYMDQTSNMYGVSLIRLFLDDEEIFNQDLSHFSFAQTRYVNALTDYEAWQKNSSWIMKSFLEPENRLNAYGIAKNRGFIQINEEKTYHFRYEISDRAGNISQMSFSIQGEKRPIPEAMPSSNLMESWLPNHFNSNDAKLTIPAGILYNNLDFQFEQVPSDGYSDIYRLLNTYTPLHQAIPFSVRIQKDIISNKKGYYLAKQDRYGRYQYIGGTYSEGMLQANIREFGTYTVKADTISPKIVALNLENDVKNRLIRIRISDNATGVKNWRGTIDGVWVLFEYDPKTALIKYRFDNNLIKGKDHNLVLILRDARDNESRYEHSFYY